MKHPIKLIIKKPKQTKGDWAFYREVERIVIEERGPIKTEAQLCYYIYRKHGVGRYQIVAFQNGHKGFWLFWLGNLYENGFLRDMNKNKDLEKLKNNFNNAQNYEEKSEIDEEIQFTKDFYEEEKKTKRRGPIGLIKSRPGQMGIYSEW